MHEKMTDQIEDTYYINGEQWRAVGISGSGHFHPREFGIIPEKNAITSCDRGFFCSYCIQGSRIFLTQLSVFCEKHGDYPSISGKKPSFEGSCDTLEYMGILHPVLFSGGLLLGKDFDDYFAPLGFWLPHAYRIIYEFEFVNGVLTAKKDWSETFKKIGEIWKQGVSGQEFTFNATRDDIQLGRWMGCVWDPDYKHWEIFRKPEEVQPGGLCPYSLPEEVMARLRSQFQETEKYVESLKQTEREKKSQKEIKARELYSIIEQQGWTCEHCGQQGVAKRDFRLSIGPHSIVICRKCGWPQGGNEAD